MKTHLELYNDLCSESKEEVNRLIDRLWQAYQSTHQQPPGHQEINRNNED